MRPTIICLEITQIFELLELQLVSQRQSGREPFDLSESRSSAKPFFEKSDIPRLMHDLGNRVMSVLIYYDFIRNEISMKLDPEEDAFPVPESVLNFEEVMQEYADKKTGVNRSVEEIQELFQALHEAYSEENIKDLIEGLNQIIPDPDPSIKSEEFDYFDPRHSRKPSFIEELAKNSERIRTFVGRYAGLSENKTTRIKVHDVLKEIHELGVYRDVSTLKLSDVNFTVRGDRLEFERAIENILKNAKEAVFEKAGQADESFEGKIEIFTKKSQGNVVIEIIDNGVGISDENLVRILDPDQLFTTKEDKGTGYGVTNAIQGIESMGGKVKIVTTPGEGTVFRITLPRVISESRRSGIEDLVESSEQRAELRDKAVFITRQVPLGRELHGFPSDLLAEFAEFVEEKLGILLTLRNFRTERTADIRYNNQTLHLEAYETGEFIEITLYTDISVTDAQEEAAEDIIDIVSRFISAELDSERSGIINEIYDVVAKIQAEGFSESRDNYFDKRVGVRVGEDLLIANGALHKAYALTKLLLSLGETGKQIMLKQLPIPPQLRDH